MIHLLFNTISAPKLKCFQHCGFNIKAILTQGYVHFLKLITYTIIYNDVIKPFSLNMEISSTCFCFRAIQHV